MLFIKRHPIIVNLILAFSIALLTGLWTNLFTASIGKDPMPDRQHLLLIVAVFLIIIQCWYNEKNSKTEKQIINELLDLGVRFFISNSNNIASLEKLRVMIHLCERTKPGPKEKSQQCLVPRYCKSPVAPRDFGAIPLEDQEYNEWYVNSQAFLKQRVICQEPDPTKRPSGNKYYIDNPSLFPAKSVISAPIWCRRQPHPYVIGTITFDSFCSVKEMNWMNGGVLCGPSQDMLNSLADLIGRILSNEEPNP